MFSKTFLSKFYTDYLPNNTNNYSFLFSNRVRLPESRSEWFPLLLFYSCKLVFIIKGSDKGFTISFCKELLKLFSNFVFLHDFRRVSWKSAETFFKIILRAHSLEIKRKISHYPVECREKLTKLLISIGSFPVVIKFS